MAEKNNFAKPEIRRRIVELIDKILLSLPRIELLNQTQNDVIGFIEQRCETLALHYQKHG